jgi:hypothetical protein
MQVRHRLASRGQVDFRDIERVARPFSFLDFNTLGQRIPLQANSRVF